jgi:tetratricopeptide (TPR) repeat protein
MRVRPRARRRTLVRAGSGAQAHDRPRFDYAGRVRLSRLISISLLTLSLVTVFAVLSAGRARAETAKAFAQRIAGAIQRGEGAMLDGAIDMDALLERSYRGLEASDTSKREFALGVKKSFGFGALISKEIEQSGSYELLRVRAVKGKQRALFRLISPSGVNYHDMELEPTRDGKGQRVVDIFIFLSGEWLSETMRRAFLPVVAHEKRGAGGAQNAFMDNLPKITELSTAVRNHDHARVLAIYKTLPPEVQKDRNVMLMYYQAASKAGDAEYAKALSAIQKAFPNDPALDLLLFDDYFLKKNYDGALAAVARVRRALGGDAYLDFLEGNIHYSKGDHEGAKVRLNRAIASEPDLVDPYWTLITISLEQRQWDETARLLDLVEQNAGVELQDVGTVAEYAEFAKSKAYQAWKQRWETRQKTKN